MKGPYKLWTGDCREVVGYGYAENTFDSIVTDPPYGLSFMGKGWDRGVPGAEFWAHALRAAKPGAYLLAFGGTRTFHRLTCAIEDAGWEIRDCIMWVYGSGFPKSHDVSKAIDKAAGAEREVAGSKLGQPGYSLAQHKGREVYPGGLSEPATECAITAPATPEAQQWEGWGTALKPAWEPIIVAQKPMKTTVAQNVLKHGTGGINVDGCRVGTDGGTKRNEQTPYAESGWRTGGKIEKLNSGRWPANLIHDGSEEVVSLFPTQAGGGFGVRGGRSSEQLQGLKATYEQVGFGDSGSAARFFYCAKTSKKDRGEGNNHPTVKPTELMRYLIRLVTQPGGVVLDPFMGSGSTGKAAMLEGMRFVGVDLSAEYVEIAKARIEHALTEHTEPEEE